MGKSLVEIGSKEHLDSTLKSSKIVVADFYTDWCGPCQQIAPLYETLANSLSRRDAFTFVKINCDRHEPLAREYSITALPTFLLFRDGEIAHRMQGANPSELRAVIQRLVFEFRSLGEDEGTDDPWEGAGVPRGYTDVSEQVEVRGCELLNADEDAGPVKVLFDGSKPSALDAANSEGAAQGKDWVQSGADDQLLLFVPFQSSIKLHTLQLTSLPPEGQDEVSRPEVIHLYINRSQNMDFGEADDTEPTQTITLDADDWNDKGTANISLRYVKFQKTTSLVIYVQKGADGAEAVRIDRLRLAGEAGVKREMGKLQKMGEGAE